MDAQIDAIYKPKDGKPGDWKGGLRLNSDRLEEYLAESPVLDSIKAAGQHLLHARCIVKDLESSECLKDMSDAVADDLCESMSRYCRMPAVRFYNSLLIMKQPFMEATRRTPKKFSDLPWTDAQYHAMVTYCFMAQVMHMNQPSENTETEIIRCMEALIKARPKDASIYVMFGNWLMMHGFTQDAVEHLEKAVELGEEACFGSHYTIANICHNAVDIEKANRAGPLAAIQAMFALEKGNKSLRRYLELAPKGHWHAPRACMTLVNSSATALARGESDSIPNMEERNPGFCAESLTTFERGVIELQLYENCYGQEQGDFKFQYEKAADMIAIMYQEGMLKGTFEKPITMDYMCANPPCTNSRWRDDESDATPTKLCVGCQSVSYCSKECQTTHWKGGHKKDCKRLAAARKERLAANPKAIKSPQIGD